MKDGLKAAVGMVCVTALGVTAMALGLNGAVFWPAITVVSGLAGFTIKGAIDKKGGG